MKPVDYAEHQKVKATREVKNYESDNFEMEIIDEGALDKVLTVPEKTLDKQNWIPIYEVIDFGYFKQCDVEYPK